MKWGILIYKLFESYSENPEGTANFIIWLISAIIETVIISAIVAAIAHASNKENDFNEWFAGSCVVVGVIEIVLGFIGMIS